MVEPAMLEAAREAGLLEPGQRLRLVLADGKSVKVTVHSVTRTDLRARPLIPGQRTRFRWDEIEEIHQRLA